MRQVRGLEGSHRIVALLEARHDYGSAAMDSIHRHDDGLLTAATGSVVLRWRVPPGARMRRSSGHALAVEFDVTQGSAHDLVLELSLEAFDAESRAAADLWQETESSWRSACAPLERRGASRDAMHACTVLTGLTTPAGGTVAAATTSLPERADTGRNYDYRYVRDRLLSDGPDLMPAYTTCGAAIPSEQSLGVLVAILTRGRRSVLANSLATAAAIWLGELVALPRSGATPPLCTWPRARYRRGA